MEVRYSYLAQQFADIDAYLEDIRRLVYSGDFTLGKTVSEFEEQFAQLMGLPFAVGVGSGTDALILPLKALGIGPGDEVITAANTFVATVGAIAMCGATPVFVDNNEQFTMDIHKIEEAITPRTKAIIPVHLSGCPADMPEIMKIAEKHNLKVIEDAAQAILASIDGQHVGSWGRAAGFSLHPLKNLNVWGDGGVVITRSKEMRDKLRLLRNHGMKNRDEIEIFGHNSRLDSLQAVIGLRLIKDVHWITEKRVEHARQFDAAFADLNDFIRIPHRPAHYYWVYHTYVVRVKERDALLAYLLNKNIQAKVHYPIPMHLQKASRHLGYKGGDFPMAEEDARTMLTLPVHQHLSPEEMEYMIDSISQFYVGTQMSRARNFDKNDENFFVKHRERE